MHTSLNRQFIEKNLPPFSNEISLLMFHSLNCQMFSMNFHQNLMHIHQNAHLQTLYETLIQTYIYLNLTYPNLGRVKKDGLTPLVGQLT